jgi:hypothetical protein
MAVSNAERAARGRKVFESVTHDDNDTLINLYDLIADLLHFGDEVAQQENLGPELVGEWLAEQATFHYREEVDEEAADAHALADAA